MQKGHALPLRPSYVSKSTPKSSLFPLNHQYSAIQKKCYKIESCKNIDFLKDIKIESKLKNTQEKPSTFSISVNSSIQTTNL